MVGHLPLKEPTPLPLVPGPIDANDETQKKDRELWDTLAKDPDEAWSKFMQARLGDDLEHVRSIGSPGQHGVTYEPSDEMQAIVACCNKANQLGQHIVWLTYSCQYPKDPKTLKGFGYGPNQGYGLSLIHI